MVISRQVFDHVATRNARNAVAIEFANIASFTEEKRTNYGSQQAGRRSKYRWSAGSPRRYLSGFDVNQDLDSSAPHRCNHARPELYLYQNEWEGTNDQACCDRAFLKAESVMQENIRKKARYRSHYRGKKTKHQSRFNALASFLAAQMAPFPGSSQILVAAKTLVSLGSHRFPSVEGGWAKVFCYVPSAFIASVGIRSVRENTGRRRVERAPARVQAGHLLAHVGVDCAVKLSSVVFPRLLIVPGEFGVSKT